MFIAGLQKTSLLDYPDKIAAIVFTQGCNFRCGYCHNPELLPVNSTQEPFVSEEDFFNFLKKRKGKLDGVVITGGEPCLQKDLIGFIRKIKVLGFLVKLDTNGSYPRVLQKLIEQKLVDYIAMDIKAPLNKYDKITNSVINIRNITQSIKTIIHSDIDYEFRTTVIQSQLSFDDFTQIGVLLSEAKQYYLQKFVVSKIYDQTLSGEKTYTDNDFAKILQILSPYIANTKIR